jgi:hypothetical protein
VGGRAAPRQRRSLVANTGKSAGHECSKTIPSKSLSANHARRCRVRSGGRQCRFKVTVAPVQVVVIDPAREQLTLRIRQLRTHRIHLDRELLS